MPTANLITFEDAVKVSHSIEDYFNSPRSDNMLYYLADHFKCTIRDGFVVKVKEFSKNCPDCAGCHSGKCTLGCYKPNALQVCYWDKALEASLGTKLIVHEMGHVLYEQILDDGLDVNSQEHYDKSETFALYFEKHFDINMSFQDEVKDPVPDLKTPLMQKDNFTLDTNNRKDMLIVFGSIGAVLLLFYLLDRRKSGNGDITS